MKKLPTSVFSFSHDSWQQLVKFYERAIAEDVVVDTPVVETPVFDDEDEDDVAV